MAYAVVVSLKQTLEPLLDSARSRFQIPNSELKPIHDQLCYVKSFFDKMISLEDSNMVGDLEKQIKEVVQNAQDLVEFHLSDLVHSVSENSISGFSRDLVKVNQQIASLMKMLKDIEGHLTGEQPSPAGVGNGRNNKTVGLADVDASSTIDFDWNNEIVGLYEEQLRRKDWLTSGRYKREVICIAGMAGIGKTTLAKMVYLDPLIKEHFHICFFVEIGVEYKLKDLLMRLLSQLVSEEMTEEMKEVTVGELGDQLYKYLYGRSYLVVLDDIWDNEAWDQIRRYFPNNGNGSRIIYTTTGVTELANDMILQMHFLDDWASWELFCKKAFPGMEVCSLELVNTGRAIVEKLGGLPLAIVMIADLLSKLERTVENWMAVAQNPISFLWEMESTILESLNVCYNKLPQRLKACFLYLGLFPPNYSIPTSQLIRLWVAEGLIEPAADKSLEQKAEEYLKDLISRSLVIVDQLSSIGRIKTCRIHQLFQELCVSEAREQKLFHIINQYTTKVAKNQQRLGIHCSDIVPGVMESVSGVRSLIFMQPDDQYQSPVFVRFRWLRVLHALSIRFGQFPEAVLKLVRLRYLAIAIDGELPPSISRLWNLEVLIIHATQILDSSMFLPIEIWKLQKLRHLVCMGFDLLDPDENGGIQRFYLQLRKLHTLLGVSGRSCTRFVLARMPNLIKLGTCLKPSDDADAVFTELDKLESLNIAAMDRSSAALRLVHFPFGIRKLTLSGCEILQNTMVILSSLQSLEVLKLRRCSFSDREWDVSEGDEFRMLKFLALEELDIERLTAYETNFPRLRRLLIRRCYELEEIHSDIGYIPTLEVIEVDDCSESVVASAKFVVEEQREMGNDDLQLRIQSSSHRC